MENRFEKKFDELLNLANVRGLTQHEESLRKFKNQVFDMIYCAMMDSKYRQDVEEAWRKFNK